MINNTNEFFFFFFFKLYCLFYNIFFFFFFFFYYYNIIIITIIYLYIFKYNFDNKFKIIISNISILLTSWLIIIIIIKKDTFDDKLVGADNSTTYPLTSSGIAWPSDADKYGSREQFIKLYADDIKNKKLVPPPHWVTGFPEYKDGYTEENFPDLKKWEHFQVWMRTAGLPNFRKLYSKNTSQDLKKGIYTIDITNSKYNIFICKIFIIIFFIIINIIQLKYININI